MTDHDGPSKDWRTVALSYERYIGQVERERDQARAELDAARATIAEIREYRALVRPALAYLDQHPGRGQGIALAFRTLLAAPTQED